MSLFIKKAYNITKDNIIAAQPLVIFMLVITLTTSALAVHTNKIAHLIFLIANILLCTAFFAGWFHMINKTIEHYKKAENDEYKNKEEEIKASWALGKEFFNGVGEYFIKTTIATVGYVAVYILILFLCYKMGLQILPHPNIDWAEFMKTANSSPAEMQKYVYSLSFQQIKAINIWILYFGSIAFIYTFLTMFLFPALFDKNYGKENCFLATFKAFNRNLFFIFKNFADSLLLLIFLGLLNTFLSVISVFFSLNIILSVVGLLISFYFMTYAVILIFLYYDEKKQ